MRRVVFLDRDGVINRAFVVDGVPTPPRNLGEVEILPGVKEAIHLLFTKEFEVVVVTNQPDVARGASSIEAVNAIHTHLSQELGIKHFFTCFHDEKEGCGCRKPKPGLLQKARKELGLSNCKSFMIGDRWKDISAGQSAGCLCYFIDYGYFEDSPKLPYTKVRSLIEATQLILEISHDNIS